MARLLTLYLEDDEIDALRAAFDVLEEILDIVDPIVDLDEDENDCD